MPSVDRTKARLTEPPSLAPPAAPFLPPGTVRTTSVSPESLPERSVGPEAWAPGSDHVDETLSDETLRALDSFEAFSTPPSVAPYGEHIRFAQHHASQQRT